MVLETEPSLLAIYIWPANHSHELIWRSDQCMINLPTVELLDTLVGIGNSSGAQIDKFTRFQLDATAAAQVGAPLIAQCHSSFECRLHERSQIRRNGLFIWEVVKPHVAHVPRTPRSVHYRGDGQFMVSGNEVSRRRLFKP
jgi:flavin reductase (DIM6/NTAB) family NADH-FMN oxidoreductase RutF